MIRLILQANELEKGKAVDSLDIFHKIPFIETEWPDGRIGADNFRDLESPRFMKTHLPYEVLKPQLEKYPNMRIIQTLRNPKDALVSYDHHLRGDCQLGAFHGSWDKFFELFKEEKRLPWGDYFENNATWYIFNKDRKESLILVYEDMKRFHREHIIKIANFLEQTLSDKVIDVTLEKSTVQEMSKNINGMMSGFLSWKSDISSFVGKSQFGDYFSK